MADPGVGGLAYSGKVMKPAAVHARGCQTQRLIWRRTGQRFDCALLNLYPSGGLACAYHTDPDLGRLWARDSVIVSVGETRPFAFREIGDQERDAAWFRVRGGDCVWMFADCNDAYEHCVYSAEGRRTTRRGRASCSNARWRRGRRAGGGAQRGGREQEKQIEKERRAGVRVERREKR